MDEIYGMRSARVMLLVGDIYHSRRGQNYSSSHSAALLVMSQFCVVYPMVLVFKLRSVGFSRPVDLNRPKLARRLGELEQNCVEREFGTLPPTAALIGYMASLTKHPFSREIRAQKLKYPKSQPRR